MFGVLRTCLALCVMGFHLLGIPLLGPYAVFSFYTLSGFLMTSVMQEKYGYSAAGRIRYGVSRAARLYPAYWASAALSLVLLVWVGEDRLRSYHPEIAWPDSPQALFQNATLLFVAPFPNTVSPRLSPPSWALTVEIFFYVLIALGISRNRRRTFVWTGASLAFLALTYVLGLGPQSRYVPVTAASLPFSVGSLLYFEKMRVQRLLDRFRVSAPLLWLALLATNAAVCAYLTGHSDPGLAGESGLFATIGISAMLLVALCYGRFPWVSKGWDNRCGRLSYPIYLAHWQMGALASCILFEKPVLAEGRDALMVFGLALMLVLVFSAAVIHLIDGPIERLRLRGRSGTKAVEGFALRRNRAACVE